MSKRADPKLIGGFVVGAIALIIAGIAIFGSGTFFVESKKYVLFFKGSVKGLNVGAPVDFRGVRVGTVRNIKIYLVAENLSLNIPVFIEIDPNRITEIDAGSAESLEVQEHIRTGTLMDLMVKKGLRAQLGIQSLVTGQLYVNLDFFPNKPLRLVNIATKYPQLPTISSPFEEISQTIETLPLEELVNKITRSIAGIEAFVNSPELKGILISMNATSRKTRILMSNLDNEIRPMIANLNSTLSEAHKVLRNINSRIPPLALGLDQTLLQTRTMMGRINQHLNPLLDSVQNTFDATRKAMEQADTALSSLHGMTGRNSEMRFELSNALKQLAGAARSLRLLADYLQRHPDALIWGRGGREGD